MTATQTKTLGRNIAAARHRAGMTQRQVGAKIGSRGVTICRWETGFMMPSITRLHRIAAAVNTTAARLLQGVRGGAKE